MRMLKHGKMDGIRLSNYKYVETMEINELSVEEQVSISGGSEASENFVYTIAATCHYISNGFFAALKSGVAGGCGQPR